MGSVENFYKWLARSNIRIGTSNVQQTIMALKIFNRQLEGQFKRMEIQGKQAYTKAQKRYADGDKHAAFKLMRSALLYRKWASKLDEFRTNLDDVQFQLSTAQDMNNFDEVGYDMLKNLCELRLTLGNPQIQKMLNELDVGYGPFASLYQVFIKKEELAEKLHPIEVREREIRQEFGEIKRKGSNNTEPDLAFDQLPDAPGLSSNDSDEGNKNPDDELFDLEKELARLRKKRNS
ncbi:hypothetical protein [Candidatus Harpocratesius sp.]